jgi:hypothetical protein
MKLDTTGVNIGDISVPYKTIEFTRPRNMDDIKGKAK